MREGEPFGVKHLAAGGDGPIGFARAAVLRVADDRVADVREVNADLVRAAGFDADAQERRLGKFPNRFVMGDRGPAGRRAARSSFSGRADFFPPAFESSRARESAGPRPAPHTACGPLAT